MTYEETATGELFLFRGHGKDEAGDVFVLAQSLTDSRTEVFTLERFFGFVGDRPNFLQKEYSSAYLFGG